MVLNYFTYLIFKSNRKSKYSLEDENSSYSNSKAKKVVNLVSIKAATGSRYGFLGLKGAWRSILPPKKYKKET